MDDMTNDQYIHTVIEKKCWHEYDLDSAQCLHCPAFREKNPAYSESLDLVAPVERKAIKERGESSYANALVRAVKELFDSSEWDGMSISEILVAIATAPPDVRVRALRSLYEGEKNESQEV